MIDSELKTERSTMFHRYIKNGLKLVSKYVKVPQEWLNDPSIDSDPQARVLRKLLVDYARIEDDRDPRKDLIINMWRFIVVLFHNDPFYRERLGWLIWQLVDAANSGAFGYEKLYAVNEKGELVGCYVGYDPQDWFGQPSGRGWKSTEKQDWYKLSPEELELSANSVRERRLEVYRGFIRDGLVAHSAEQQAVVEKEISGSTE